MPYNYDGPSLAAITENGGPTEAYNDVTYVGGESVIIVVAAWGLGPIVGLAVDDGGAHTYLPVTGNPFGEHISLFYCHGVTAGTYTLRTTRTSGDVGTLRAFRFSSIGGSPLVSAGQEFTGSGAASPDNVPVGSPNVPTVPALLFAAARRQNDASTMVAGSGFTFGDYLNHLPAPGNPNGLMQHRRVTSTGVVNVFFSQPPDDFFEQYEVVTVAFAEITPPTITTQPVAEQVDAGATATYTVAATGGTLSYQWQESPNGGDSYSNVSGGSGGTTASYTTPATVAADNGKRFRCVVTDSNGSTNSFGAYLHLLNQNSGQGHKRDGLFLAWTVRKQRSRLINHTLLRKSQQYKDTDSAEKTSWEDWIFPATASTSFEIWDGSAWVPKPVQIWNGSAWVTKPMFRWDGSAWV